MATSEPDARTTALLAHVVTQMQLNVAFLESENYLSPQDAETMRNIIQRVRQPTAAVVVATDLKVHPHPHPSTMPSYAVPPAPPRTADPSRAVYAEALWGYNEDGAVRCMLRCSLPRSTLTISVADQEPNDLPFSAGAIIEIIEETNEDWWKGRLNGRQGLFPANHVKKVAPPAIVATDVQPTPVYRPFGAALHGTDAPPPAGTGVNSVGLQQAAQPENKNNKFGKYGNTVIYATYGLGAVFADRSVDGPFGGRWTWLRSW